MYIKRTSGCTYILVEGRKGVIVVKEVLCLSRRDDIAEWVWTGGRHVMAVQLGWSWRGCTCWWRWRPHWLFQPNKKTVV